MGHQEPARSSVRRTTAHIPRLPRSISAAMRGARRAGSVLEPLLVSSSELIGYLPYRAYGRTLHYRVDNAHYLEAAQTEPPGILFFFDGDYLLRSNSRLLSRTSSLRRDLADIAREHRMLCVPVLAPGTLEAPVFNDPTTTWWVRARRNGRVFRALAADLAERHGYDRTRIWLAGYSGGAEFITYELLSHSNDWLLGGGASMIGGGGSDGIPQRFRGPSRSLNGMLLSWHVGDRDGKAPASAGQIWSAQRAAHEGEEFYRGRQARTMLRILPKQGHRGYPLTSLIRDDLRAATRLGYL